MPKITIFEKDLTKAGINSSNNNIAYIPGYSIMGPVNTPTLCTSLKQFIEIFGSMPYKFREAQYYPENKDIYYAYAGDIEKSYIYASELLNKGLPILFERVMTAENWNALIEIPFLEDSKNKLIIEAKNPGFYGTFINYNIDNLTKLVEKDININLAPIYTYTTNKQAQIYKDTTCLQKHEGIKLEANVTLEVLDTNETSYKINLDSQVPSQEYFIKIVDVTKKETLLSSYLEAGTYINSESKINGEQITQSYTTQTRIDLENGDLIKHNSRLAFGSLINGQDTVHTYTNEIIKGDQKNLYTITINLKKDNEYGILNEITKVYKISFDPSDEHYYSKINSNLVNFKTKTEGADSSSANQLSTGVYSLDLSQNISGNLKLLESQMIEGKPKDEFTVKNMYLAMKDDISSGKESIFNKLADKGEYQIKFITTGTYPVLNYDNNKVTYKILKVAADRGDATALIDHINDPSMKVVGEESLLATVQKLDRQVSATGEDIRKYGAMFTPWAVYSNQLLPLNTILPASFAYLSALANSVKTNANWYAIAGVTRGLVIDLLQPSQIISGAIAQELQGEYGISINPITNIKPYGYCIWGNRTLNENEGLIASSFLNIRALTNDIKKAVYAAARKLTFELNNDILWLNFKSEIEPLLDKMISGNGLSNYKIIKKASSKKATIEAIIRLYPIEAVENWDITVELADNYVSVE